jgi:hypothetical protein
MSKECWYNDFKAEFSSSIEKNIDKLQNNEVIKVKLVVDYSEYSSTLSHRFKSELNELIDEILSELSLFKINLNTKNVDTNKKTVKIGINIRKRVPTDDIKIEQGKSKGIIKQEEALKRNQGFIPYKHDEAFISSRTTKFRMPLMPKNEEITE